MKPSQWHPAARKINCSLSEFMRNFMALKSKCRHRNVWATYDAVGAATLGCITCGVRINPTFGEIAELDEPMMSTLAVLSDDND